MVNILLVKDGGKTKGRITVEDIGVYLCQNKLDGLGCKEKYGYNYSYFIEKRYRRCFGVTGIKNNFNLGLPPKRGGVFLC